MDMGVESMPRLPTSLLPRRRPFPSGPFDWFPFPPLGGRDHILGGVVFPSPQLARLPMIP
eukprot:8883415-Karenia_brevis.AAC.1